MNKLKKITAGALTLMFTTSLTTFAAVPNGSVVIGTKAYDLAYANKAANSEEIRLQVINGGSNIYVKGFDGKWYDNITGGTVSKNVIPEVTYKNAEGNTLKYAVADGDEVKSTTASSGGGSRTGGGGSSSGGGNPSTGVSLSDLNKAGEVKGNFTISKDGTFGPEDGEGTVNVKGDITLTSDSAENIQLRNMEIFGKLTIRTPKGHITLHNTKVLYENIVIKDVSNGTLVTEGEVTAKGMLFADPNGGSLENRCENFDVPSIEVAPSGTGTPEATFKGNFGAAQIKVTKSVKIKAEANEDGQAFNTNSSIILAAETSNAEVGLSGDFGDVAFEVTKPVKLEAGEGFTASKVDVKMEQPGEDQTLALNGDFGAAAVNINTPVKLTAGEEFEADAVNIELEQEEGKEQKLLLSGNFGKAALNVNSNVSLGMDNVKVGKLKVKDSVKVKIENEQGEPITEEELGDIIYEIDGDGEITSGDNDFDMGKLKNSIDIRAVLERVVFYSKDGILLNINGELKNKEIDKEAFKVKIGQEEHEGLQVKNWDGNIDLYFDEDVFETGKTVTITYSPSGKHDLNFHGKKVKPFELTETVPNFSSDTTLVVEEGYENLVTNIDLENKVVSVVEGTKVCDLYEAVYVSNGSISIRDNEDHGVNDDELVSEEMVIEAVAQDEETTKTYSIKIVEVEKTKLDKLVEAAVYGVDLINENQYTKVTNVNYSTNKIDITIKKDADLKDVFNEGANGISEAMFFIYTNSKITIDDQSIKSFIIKNTDNEELKNLLAEPIFNDKNEINDEYREFKKNLDYYDVIDIVKAMSLGNKPVDMRVYNKARDINEKINKIEIVKDGDTTAVYDIKNDKNFNDQELEVALNIDDLKYLNLSDLRGADIKITIGEEIYTISVN